jgi:hypothetical protein
MVDSVIKDLGHGLETVVAAGILETTVELQVKNAK